MTKRLMEKSELKRKIHNALRAWKNVDGIDGDLLSDLLLVRQRRDRELLTTLIPAVALRLAANGVLLEGLELLKDQNEENANILRDRFLNGQKTEQVANKIGFSTDTVNRKQREGLEMLTELVWQMEEDARARRVEQMLEQLPLPTYSRLFGVAEKLAKLAEQLLQMEGVAYITAVEGVGGLGKTALVDADDGHCQRRRGHVDCGRLIGQLESRWLAGRRCRHDRGGRIAQPPIDGPLVGNRAGGHCHFAGRRPSGRRLCRRCSW